ncbi:GspE/PulE family protein, partial [Chloroflexota bacterium]
RQTIDYSYKSFGDIEKQLSKAGAQTKADGKAAVVEDVSEAPIVRALDMIMNEAVKVRASDIHIEPQEDRLRVRYRIDGVLQDTMSLSLSAHAPLISRIKIMAKMNIADSRPQDGQLSFKVKNQDIDVRVATINTIYGQMGTMRILDKALAASTLPELGFSPSTLDNYQKMLKSPLGMIIVCGPTGSGKTTTIYASINGLDRKERKVVTIEDPVEYRFPDIDQIQVNPKADITFASAVRSFLRHDPDVIMIGEIRDPDTASMATQASLVGQLVLSTVHSNDAASSIARLLDLGIGPYLIATTLLCVVSQRMARRVCPYCQNLIEIPQEELTAYYVETGDTRTEFWVGSGCNACSKTGYLGRVPISEIMVMNHELRSAVMKGASSDEIRQIAKNSGMLNMWRDGMLKAQAGITTPSEVMRNILFTG